jgi:hypothetical protein
MSVEQIEAYEKLVAKRTSTSKKNTSDTAKRHYHTVARLALDDALEQLQKDPSKAMAGWSEARIKAYKAIDSKPNTYYYRFNAPGEEQRTGAWTTAERKLFFDRLAEIGADGQWGIFSMTIPGRVGYQCSNFYRQLVVNGEVHDPNYVIDEKGKVHYLFATKQKNKDGTVKRTFRTHTKHIMKGAQQQDNSDDQSTGTRSSVPRTKRKKRARDEDSDDSSGEWYESTRKNTSSWRTTARTRSNAADNLDDEDEEECPVAPVNTFIPDSEDDEDDYDPNNPIPDFVDPITLDPVVRPAISPYGHVMSYNTWLRCLTNPNSKNICPLTKNPLSKRDLVVLTFENIEEYR